MRTGPLRNDAALELKQDSELLICHDQAEGEDGRISTTYPEMYRFVSPGNRVLLDDGRLEAEVVAIEGRDIR